MPDAARLAALFPMHKAVSLTVPSRFAGTRGAYIEAVRTALCQPTLWIDDATIRYLLSCPRGICVIAAFESGSVGGGGSTGLVHACICVHARAHMHMRAVFMGWVDEWYVAASIL